MIHFHYATINENGICVGVKNVFSEINSPNEIKLNYYDTSVIGKRYYKGKWFELPVQPEGELPPTIEELQTQIDNMQLEMMFVKDTVEILLIELVPIMGGLH